MILTLKNLLFKKFGNDSSNVIWLIILYLFQGVPVGLAFSTIPFLLHKSATYTQIGIFTFSAFPYSLKILWSPFVDSIYSHRFGRRKSWIVPMQLIAGVLLLILSPHIEEMIENATNSIWTLTTIFFFIIVLMSTQDIAVDGWALTILSKKNLHFASTCQSIGLTSGFFLSYSIFLTLNSEDFSNKYLRFTPQTGGILSLSNYFVFWGLAYIFISLYLAFWKSEDREPDSPNLQSSFNFTFNNNNSNSNSSNSSNSSNNNSIKDNKEDDEEEVEDISSKLEPMQIYKSLWKIINLSHIQTLSLILLTCKIVFQSNDALSLRLLEKGMKKEDLASFSVIQFPCTLFFSVIASKMVKDKPLSLWTNGYLMGLGVVFLNMIALYNYQPGWFYYLVLLLISLFSSFVSTTLLVSQGSFFLKISDKAIGGTYLTLLNTVANLGGTWPKFPVLYLIDFFSKNICITPNGNYEFNGISEQRIQHCKEQGGRLETIRDGYFIVTITLVIYGLFMHRILKSKFVPIQYVKPIPIRGVYK